MSDTNTAIVAKLTNIQPIPGADRIVQAEVLGEAVIIGKDYNEGDVGIFFPAGLCISGEFALANSLFKKHPETGAALGGYLEPNGRVRFLKMKKVVSRGIWLPLSSMNMYLKVRTAGDPELLVGTQFNAYGGHQICWKYVSPDAKTAQDNNKNKPGKARSVKYENFYEIGDTSRMVYNLHTFKKHTVAIVTEKLHGTSGRSGYLPIKRTPNWLDKVFGVFGFERPKRYGYPLGTRRMVIGENSPSKELFRREIHERLIPFLRKGQIVYYEIVGYEDAGKSIMPPHTIDGKQSYYSYGTKSTAFHPYDFYVYKIVDHNANGDPITYTWEQMTAWCRQREIKHVPLLDVFVCRQDVSDEWLKWFLEYLHDISDGESSLDSTHIREGVCLTIDGKTYKHKGNTFCLAEDILPYSREDDA